MLSRSLRELMQLQTGNALQQATGESTSPGKSKGASSRVQAFATQAKLRDV